MPESRLEEILKQISVRLRAGLGLGVVMLSVFSIAVALASLVLMPNAAGTLFRSRDLLVRLALLTVACKLLAWLAAAPGFSAVLTPSFPLRLLNLSFGIYAKSINTTPAGNGIDPVRRVYLLDGALPCGRAAAPIHLAGRGSAR